MTNTGAILLIEDNSDDALLIVRALRQLRIPNPLHTFRSAEEAIHYLLPLTKTMPSELGPLPQIIFLDLNLPGLQGIHFLSWLRGQRDLRHLPVVVLTGSPYSTDVTRAYQAGANSFLSKPADLQELTHSLRQVTDFWLAQEPASTIVPIRSDREPLSRVNPLLLNSRPPRGHRARKPLGKSRRR